MKFFEERPIVGLAKRVSATLLRFAWIRRQMEDFAGAKKRALRAADRKQRYHRVVPTIVVTTILILFFWFLGSRIAHYFSWPQSAYTQSELYNLTNAQIKWDVFYGKSPMCGKIECHLTAAYPAENFLKQMVLPAREYPLKGYTKGQFVYLRATIKIPQALIDTKDTIMIHTLYMWAERYDFYINEQVVNEGGKQLINISIPRSYIRPDNSVDLAFRIDPGNEIYQGLSNNAFLVMGPSIILQKMAFAADEIQTTYYLWFLLPTITLGIIFIFLFLLVARKPGSLVFILYSFCTAAAIFFASSYPSMMLPFSLKWISLAEISEALASVFLLQFIHDFFYERERPNQGMRIGSVIAVALICFAINFFAPPQWATYLMNWVVISLRETAVVYGLYLCILSVLHHSDQKDNALNSSSFLLLFFSVSVFIVTIWFSIRAGSLILGHNGVPLSVLKFSFNLLKVFDLAFFVTLAAINAMEVGVSIARKEFVEKELEEAASMARAFRPDDDPNWLHIDVDIFHRPLTETSGDWFAFSSSSQGDFCHFIMCDITGHGIQAALVVSTAKTILSQITNNQPQALEDQGFLLTYIRELGRTLFEQGKGYHTLTLVGLSFDVRQKVLHYISAGHPFPLLISGDSAENCTIKPLISRSKILGSTLDASPVTLQQTPFAHDAQVICYTDGVPLKMSGPALKRTIFNSTLPPTDDAFFTISAEQIFKTAWAEERLKSGRRPDDDTSIVVFRPKINKAKNVA